MLYGFALTWAILLVSLVTVNVAFGHGELLIFPLPLSLLALAFSILISGLAASIGVLVSLRAGSVRQAQQMMSIGMFVLFIPFMLIQFIPANLLQSLGETLKRTDPALAAIWVIGGLLILDVVLIAIGMRLFQRSKLILD